MVTASTAGIADSENGGLVRLFITVGTVFALSAVALVALGYFGMAIFGAGSAEFRWYYPVLETDFVLVMLSFIALIVLLVVFAMRYFSK